MELIFNANPTQFHDIHFNHARISYKIFQSMRVTILSSKKKNGEAASEREENVFLTFDEP